MIKAVIFDLGFTLVGNEDFTIPKYLKMLDKGINNVANYLREEGVLKKRDIKRFIRRFKKLRYETFDRSFKENIEYSSEYVLEKTLEALEIEYNDDLIKKSAGIYHVNESKFWKPFPNTQETLKKIKNMGIKIALLSNGPYDRGIRTLLEILDLKRYFDLIETSANIGHAKPHPKTFNTVIKKLGLKHNETIMVGDDLLNDCKGAADLNIMNIKVKKPFDFPYEKELDFTPDYTVDEIKEVPKIIMKINKNL
ncbi:MAG: HAD-IA family hydrolase [Candidatus Lokiarchaeota archaeon]|nr:HAD-IA family hydrolase [Candidatus Lokiarchaeota archaeon]